MSASHNNTNSINQKLGGPINADGPTDFELNPKSSIIIGKAPNAPIMRSRSLHSNTSTNTPNVIGIAPNAPLLKPRVLLNQQVSSFELNPGMLKALENLDKINNSDHTSRNSLKK